jgi:hypothetical protein
MGREAVFYFDVLGFRHMAGGTADAAIDALSDLAEILRIPEIFNRTEAWSHRYALSDSVFLTRSDPAEALRHASELVFNLVQLSTATEEPTLVRGALAFAEVRHLRGIFLTTSEPANLVGKAVVEAVTLTEAYGLKGPRIFLSDALAGTIAGSEPELAEWQLRPTSTPGVWEVLWILPPAPSQFVQDELAVNEVCKLALRLLRQNGGHPLYGAHYREFALLAGRCIERVAKFSKSGRLTPNLPLTTFLPAAEVKEVFDTTSGLPDEYIAHLQRLVESIGR